MGHTRLGTVPKTRKWNEIVQQVAGSSLADDPVAVPASISSIAAQTLDAAQRGLEKAVGDTGVRYTFYLLTQIALASRTTDWDRALATLGIHLSDDSTVFDFTAQLQDAIDRYVGQSSTGATDLSEIAQQSAGEAITSLAGTRTVNMFGRGSADLQNAVRALSTKKGFADLGQRFFGRFVSRFLNFYLSRITAASLGGRRLHNLGDVAEFDDSLRNHCDQSARIVRDFCGEWYSKTEYQTGINLENTSRFLAVAMNKLQNELAEQRADL
jgi:hypothetical protein